jgi:hypothetical protein
VWEIIGALRSAPEEGEVRVAALGDRLGLTQAQIRSAISYYGEYPDEIDSQIAANELEATRLESALERERELLA